jgi:hypothetical protein
MDRMEVAKSFSEISRNAPRTTFKITYTATDGNVIVDKEFQQFCFDYANNEYLQGIALLLKSWRHYRELGALNEYIQAVGSRVEKLEDDVEALKNPVPKVEVKDELKTF